MDRLRPAMFVVLALASSAVWGISDFLGGLLSKRAPALAIVLLGQAASLIALVGVIWLLPGEPTRTDLAWGAVGGAAGVSGLGLFYRSLASGRMSVVAPTTAIASALVPLVFSLAIGEHTSVLALSGAVVGLAAGVDQSGTWRSSPFPIASFVGLAKVTGPRTSSSGEVTRL